jgi:hypothetical protein
MECALVNECRPWLNRDALTRARVGSPLARAVSFSGTHFETGEEVHELRSPESDNATRQLREWNPLEPHPFIEGSRFDPKELCGFPFCEYFAVLCTWYYAHRADL